MTPPDRLSVPVARVAPPRPLTEVELDALGRVADVLCPGDDRIPSPTRHPAFRDRLPLAVATRWDAFDALVDLVAAAPADPAELDTWLRATHAADPMAFQALSTVVAGAFLLLPDVREALGYPGQTRNPPRFEEAADEIGDGILDPVVDRGPIFVPTPTARTGEN